MTRLRPRRDYLALKAATRRLIEKAGGNESAASITRPNRTRVSQYRNPNESETFAPIDAILDWETDVGLPMEGVVAEMARLLDCTLIHLPTCDAVDIRKQAARLSKDCGAYFEALFEALRKGGIDTADAEALQRKLQDVVMVATAGIRRLDTIIDDAADQAAE